MEVPYFLPPTVIGVAERMNGMLKEWLTKTMMECCKSWVHLLPVVLCEIRMAPRTTVTFWSNHGRPFPTPWVKSSPGLSLIGDLPVAVTDFTQVLIETFWSIHGGVSCSLPIPAERPTHPFVAAIMSIKKHHGYNAGEGVSGTATRPALRGPVMGQRILGN